MPRLTPILLPLLGALLAAYLLAVSVWFIAILSLHTAQPGGLSIHDILSDCAVSAHRTRFTALWFVPATFIAALMLRDPAEPPAMSNRCPKCDYDLRGLPDRSRCPECGVPTT